MSITEDERDTLNDENSPSPSYCEALEYIIDLSDGDPLGSQANEEYVRGQLELIGECFGRPGARLTERIEELKEDIARILPEQKIVVGIVEPPTRLRKFDATPEGYEQATEFISTLDGHLDGRYYLDVPENADVHEEVSS